MAFVFWRSHNLSSYVTLLPRAGPQCNERLTILIFKSCPIHIDDSSNKSRQATCRPRRTCNRSCGRQIRNYQDLVAYLHPFDCAHETECDSNFLILGTIASEGTKTILGAMIILALKAEHLCWRGRFRSFILRKCHRSDFDRNTNRIDVNHCMPAKDERRRRIESKVGGPKASCKRMAGCMSE